MICVLSRAVYTYPMFYTVEIYVFGHLPSQLTTYILTMRWSVWTELGQFSHHITNIVQLSCFHENFMSSPNSIVISISGKMMITLRRIILPLFFVGQKMHIASTVLSKISDFCRFFVIPNVSLFSTTCHLISMSHVALSLLLRVRSHCE